MLNGVELPIIGNVTRDPELQFSTAGKAWIRFSVAVNRFQQNRDSGERKETATFINCKAFGDLAENIAASVRSGTRVIAYGRLEEEKWNDKEGNPRTSMSFLVDEIGPSLRWAQTPNVEKVARGGGGGNGGGGYGGGRSQQASRPAQSEASGSNYAAPAAEPSTEENPFF